MLYAQHPFSIPHTVHHPKIDGYILFSFFLLFCLCAVEQCLHVTGVIRSGALGEALPILVKERMVNVEISVEATTYDDLHDLVHIRIAVLEEGLLEVRELSADITEVNDRELIRLHELFDVLVEITEAIRLQPAADAHLHREVRAVTCELKGATIAIRIPDEAGYTTGLRNRRIVRMQR